MHLVNRTYDELAAGDSAELKRLITTDDLFAFAVCSGNHNPLHLSEAIASQAHSPQQSVAPGLFIASLHIDDVKARQILSQGIGHTTDRCGWPDQNRYDHRLVPGEQCAFQGVGLCGADDSHRKRLQGTDGFKQALKVAMPLHHQPGQRDIGLNA
ncbi:MAG: hypothetical protein EBX63_06770, partial [Betaproteobacteria bacterium]|nr:hypothetical protein [Betaproteobacteria bacterium]